MASLRRVREDAVELGGIPARVYVPTGADGVLLLGHGGGHSKDGPRFVDLSRRYADRTGLAVVCIDAVDHGERQPAGRTPGVPREWHSSAIDQMVEDWRTTAEALEPIGPAVAYVGFSMGSIFGLPTVAAMPSMRVAVFVVGGIPTGFGIDDAPLGPRLLAAAARLDHVAVLMLNKADDPYFPAAGTRALYDAIPGTRKRLRFLDGDHDDWPPELIDESINFIAQHRPEGSGA